MTTEDAKAMVRGRGEDVLRALGLELPRNANGHVDCPYPGHGGKNDWRWDPEREQAVCTCAGYHSVFDVVQHLGRASDFEEAKLVVAELLGERDQIRQKGKGKRKAGPGADPDKLLAPGEDQRDDELPKVYLAHRLGEPPERVLMPDTPWCGWQALGYYLPPGDKGGRPKNAGDWPAAVFEANAPDGRKTAMRIYLAAGGRGKAADLPDGEDAKKQAQRKGDQSPAGAAVHWGDPAKAEHTLLCEGIETGAALAHVYQEQIGAGDLVVAAALNANGVRAYPPQTASVCVCADRDEDGEQGSRAGELAAHAFAQRNAQTQATFALPGNPGEKWDFLDLLNAQGAEAVRQAVDAATRAGPDPDLRAYVDELGKEGRAPSEVRTLAEQRYGPGWRARMGEDAYGRKLVKWAEGDDPTEEEETGGFRYERLVRRTGGDQATWFLTISGYILQLTTDHLFQHYAVRKQALEQHGLFLPKVKPADWEKKVRVLTSQAEIEHVGEGASTRDALKHHLNDFLNAKAQARNWDELLLGKPFPDAKGERPEGNPGDFYFRVDDFFGYLTTRRVTSSRNLVVNLLHDLGAQAIGRRKIKGKQVSVWRLPWHPDFAPQNEGYDVPRRDDATDKF